MKTIVSWVLSKILKMNKTIQKLGLICYFPSASLCKCTPHILCLLILRACTYIVDLGFQMKWGYMIHWSFFLSLIYTFLSFYKFAPHTLLVNWFAHLFSIHIGLQREYNWKYTKNDGLIFNAGVTLNYQIQNLIASWLI